jgi:hypothetical protein
VRLDAARLGSRWITSHEALQRFAQALTPCLNDERMSSRRSPVARRRASDQAANELDKIGIR